MPETIKAPHTAALALKKWVNVFRKYAHLFLPQLGCRVNMRQLVSLAQRQDTEGGGTKSTSNRPR